MHTEIVAFLLQQWLHAYTIIMPYTDIGYPFFFIYYYFGINGPVIGTRTVVLVDVCASKRMHIYSSPFMSVCTSRFENSIANVPR